MGLIVYCFVVRSGVMCTIVSGEVVDRVIGIWLVIKVVNYKVSFKVSNFKISIIYGLMPLFGNRYKINYFGLREWEVGT